MAEISIQFMLGELTASVKSLAADVATLQSTVAVLNAHMNQNKGGMRVLLSLCAGSAVLGGGVVTLAQWALQRVHG
jgi:hypothetical protein